MFKFLKFFYSVNALRVILALFLVCFGVDVFATGSVVTLSTMQSHITTAVGELGNIIMDVATISGAGFVFASFFKFHQHKLNPTQVGLSNGVTLLLVGAGLCIFPHLIGTGSKTLFGQTIDKAGSNAAAGIIGGGKPGQS